MNRYKGGLLITACLAILGLYMLYKSIRGEEFEFPNGIIFSPKLTALCGAMLIGIFLAYLWLGHATGVIYL